jgi:hypothetical protein
MERISSGHGAALQPAFGQQLGNLARMFKACSVAVDMQDAFLLQIEVNAFAGRPVKQVLACRNRQPGGLHGVFLVMGDGSEKLAEPGNLVPAGLGVEQQRSIALEHPLEALDDGGPMGPDLGVRGRELAAIGERGFHGGIALLLEQGDGKSAACEGVGGGHARDATADDGDCLHDSDSRCVKGGARAQHAQRTPPLFWT